MNDNEAKVENLLNAGNTRFGIDALDGLNADVVNPAPKTDVTSAATEKKSKPGKTGQQEQATRKYERQIVDEDNTIRATFHCDATQWDWISDYAYTKRMNIKDLMYQVIEDFQSAHSNERVFKNPARHKRPKKKNK